MKKIAFLSLVVALCGGNAFAGDSPEYLVDGAHYNCRMYDTGSTAGYNEYLRFDSQSSKYALYCSHDNIWGCHDNAAVVSVGTAYNDGSNYSGLNIWQCYAGFGRDDRWIRSTSSSGIAYCAGSDEDFSNRNLTSLGHVDGSGMEYFCATDAYFEQAGTKYCIDQVSLGNGKACQMKTCESKFGGDTNAVNCCRWTRAGKARWNPAARMCSCTENGFSWNEASGQCVQGGNGGGNNGDGGNGDLNANLNQNQNQNQNLNNASSSSGVIVNVTNIINSCINEENNPTTCRQMHEEPDCERDYAGFPELIACCIHQKVHLTTFTAGRSCQCLEADKEWDSEARTCMKKTKKQQQNRQTCEERFSAYPARLACCKAGQDTYWEGDLVNGKCICGAPSGPNARRPNGKVWTWNGGTTGYCADPTNPVNPVNPVDPVTPVDPNPQPEYVECNYTFTAKVRCKDGTKLDAMTNKTFTFAKGGSVIKGADGACQAVGMIDIAMMLKNQFCQSHQGLYDGPDDAAVEAAKSSLQSFFQTAQSTASVWKNADGQFNTARLASDATAGVVLGTVGGIVSAKVIKKKQLEKGYDALNCTIGGQKIADWGDEFQVGYSR